MKISEIKYGFLLIFMSLMLTNCNSFLEEDPPSVLSPTKYFNNQSQAEAALNGVYDVLQTVYNFKFDWLVTDIENIGWNSIEGLKSYTHTAGNSDIVGWWAEHYDGINRANTVIDRVPDIDMDERAKNALIGEAKFLRALFYFNAVRLWGNIPLVISESTPNSVQGMQQASMSQVYDQIIEDLEFAIDNCYDKGEAAIGKATRSAAIALLSKVYLTRGSMKKRDKSGDPKSDFSQARSLANTIITEGKYNLVKYYPDIHHHKNQNNEEIIFDVQKVLGGSEADNYNLRGTISGDWDKGGSWEMANHTVLLHTMYEPSDSVRRDWSSCHVQVRGFDKIYIYKESENDLYWWNQYWGNGKYRRFPVENPSTYNPTSWNAQFIIMRFSEVLLIFAEADLEATGTVNKDAIDAINRIRERCRYTSMYGPYGIHSDIFPRQLKYNPTSMLDLSNSNFTSPAEFMRFIQDERARELSSEAIRWFDLVRWGILVERIHYTAYTLHPGHKQLQMDYPSAENVKEYHQLLPIPENEIRLNEGWVQNPGY